ncbi:MAG: hypothetical protein VZR76_00935 [Candidatus Enteromonas sp.]|nr:hypothetical protein [Bacilli bacterium]MBQ2052479.1 hypothetical protein [Bacilli bacterium]MEE3401567.1 hypothetical protein [Candidatus Enteromonas sp.]MEE3431967.1 hypothetical protein [Candidatus Enteromonas sp.]MEE3442833.1 hypothetical protein [Candidatus Enteromonas sp.]
MKWFNSQSRLVQLILLLIPVVNWIVEIFVRVTAVLEKPNLGNILGLIFGIIIPIFGWIDLVWVLLFNHLLLAK